MNDWQLVSAFVQGDEAAFESLARKSFPMVYAAAIRQTDDRRTWRKKLLNRFIEGLSFREIGEIHRKRDGLTCAEHELSAL